MKKGALSVRFREPKTFCEEEELVEKAVPSSTKHKNKWALSVFGEWQFARTIKVPFLDPGGLFKDYDLHKVADALYRYRRNVLLLIALLKSDSISSIRISYLRIVVNDRYCIVSMSCVINKNLIKNANV